MFYHHVLAWKACYTYFSAVLFKPTSRTRSDCFQLVRINPSGGARERLESLFKYQGFQLVRINPSGGELGFRTTTQQDFQTPKSTHPFDKKINMGIFAKMTTFKPSPSMASTQVNERIRVSAILGGASTGFS